MLKLNSVFCLTLSLIFLSNVVSKIRAEESEILNDVSDPGTSWDSNKMPDAPPGETDQNQEQAQSHDDHPHEGEVPEDEGQHDEAPAQPEAHDEAGANAVTGAANRLSQEEKKLTPELVEKFTTPLLENRWKWDYRREALVKNFWFASFNEFITKRVPYRTLPPTTLAPLTFEQEQEHITPLIRRGWIKDKTRNIIRKDFYFKTFYGAFSFMTQMALMAEKISHFPDWFNNNNKVKVSLSSKQIRAISMKDIVLAKYADRVYPAQKFL